jgi:tetratricopeptide (TPR) repeat protein
MRWRLRLPAAVLVTLVCTVHGGIAFSQQNSDGPKQQAILEIQKLIEDRDLVAASRSLSRAAEEFPQDPGFDNLRGIVEAQQGNYKAAESSFNRAIQSEPRLTGAYLNLGRLYQENSTADPRANWKALDVYKRVLAYDSTNAEANYQSAALLLRQGHYRASLDHVAKLSAATQASAQTLSILCADYAGLGDRERTEAAAARLGAHPDFSEPDAQQALLGLIAGKRDDLIVSLLAALERRQPLSLDALHALGLAYERAGRLSDARDTLERLANEKPGTAPLLELARVAHKQRDYKGSLGYLAHARDLQPGDAAIHYSFGVVCVDLNLVAEARNSFEKSVKLAPDNPSYNYAMGATSSYGHDPGEAVPYFEKYLKLMPKDARGKLALGVALFRAKDFDAAVPHLLEAAKLSETSTAAHYYLGSIDLAEHRLDDALKELQQALKAKPNYADALAELGQYYLIRKDYEQAAANLDRALQIDRDHFAANFYLLTLYTRTGDPRREGQAKRFEELQKLRDEKTQELLRIVEVRPFESTTP